MLGYNPEIASGVFSGMSTFFGLEIDPRGNIIGILIACIFGAWVEKQVRKIIPGNLDMILTSTLTLLIVGAVTYVAIMPIGSWLFSGMSWLFMHLNSNPFGTAILAGLFLIAVMFGVHQGFIPVYLALVDAQGFNSLFPILAMAGGGQVGAAIALYVKAKKDSLLRNQIRGAIIPGFLGIAEPLIYGVTLPRVKPFITACLGGAAGGILYWPCCLDGATDGTKYRIWSIRLSRYSIDDLSQWCFCRNERVCHRVINRVFMWLYFHVFLWQ